MKTISLSNKMDLTGLTPWITIGIIIFILWLFLGGRGYKNIDTLSQDEIRKVFDIHATNYNNVCYNNEEDIVSSESAVKASLSAFERSADATKYVLNPQYNDEEKEKINNMKSKIIDGSKWKKEGTCCAVLTELYGKEFKTSRPHWLKNPETGGILELDCYNEELKIAAEYNGIQHYVFPNKFHKSYEEFISQVRRDQFKAKMCDEMGVYLITIPYNVPHDKIRDYILHYAPENVSARVCSRTCSA